MAEETFEVTCVGKRDPEVLDRSAVPVQHNVISDLRPFKLVNKVPCPKCGIFMDLLVESENVGNEKVVRYYYRCPACGFRLTLSTIRIVRKDSEIALAIEK